MYVVPQGNTVYFDVDDTLIYWDDEKIDSSILDLARMIRIELNGQEIIRYSIEENVREIMLQKLSGCHVVVWSASGSQWAAAVIEALEMSEYVDVVVSKPTQYYDDKDCKDWMPAKRRHYGPIFKS